MHADRRHTFGNSGKYLNIIVLHHPWRDRLMVYRENGSHGWRTDMRWGVPLDAQVLHPYYTWRLS